MSAFGLSPRDRQALKMIFKKFPQITEVLVFGSRSMSNHKKGSDIDLAIKGKKINPSITDQLIFALNEELNLPYFFDVVDYAAISNKDLKAHIDEYGKVLYEATGVSLV